MRIQSVMVDGYKNLFNVKIAFDNITALVALNIFGKSNVLFAMDFAISFIKGNIDDKARMMSNSDLMPINKDMIGRNFKYSMEFSTIFNNEEYFVQYGFEFAWKTSRPVMPKIVSEFLKIKQNDTGQKYAQFINRNDSEALFKSSENGRCSSKIKVEQTELVINKLSAFDDIFYLDIIQEINAMKIYMENNFDADAFYHPDPIIRKGFEDEMIDVNNLPRIIYNLKQTYPEKYKLLIDVFTQIFPDIEEIIVNQVAINPGIKEGFPEDAPFLLHNYIYVLYVKDRNLSQLISFLSMSDGVKRVFMILAKIIIANISNISLIAVEEPENSVHPSLFQYYINVISQLLDDCKIIITSHSPYIISYLNPAWIYVGMNRKGGVAEFFPFKKSGQKQLQRDAQKYSMSMGDYLFSLLSDSDSYESLKEYLECD